MERDGHAARAPAENATLAVRLRAHAAVRANDKGVVERAAEEIRRAEAVAEAHGLHAGNREERGGKFRFKSVEERAAQPRRQPRHRAGNPAADGIARVARRLDLAHHPPFARLAVDRLDGRRDVDAARREKLLAESARRADGRREAPRVLAAARRDGARLDPLAEVGVAGTRHRARRAVVAWPRVGVADLAADRLARRDAVRNARREDDGIRFAPLGRQPITPRRAPFHERREGRRIDGEALREPRQRKPNRARVRCAAYVKLQAFSKHVLAPSASARTSWPPCRCGSRCASPTGRCRRSRSRRRGSRSGAARSRPLGRAGRDRPSPPAPSRPDTSRPAR